LLLFFLIVAAQSPLFSTPQRHRIATHDWQAEFIAILETRFGEFVSVMREQIVVKRDIFFSVAIQHCVFIKCRRLCVNLLALPLVSLVKSFWRRYSLLIVVETLVKFFVVVVVFYSIYLRTRKQLHQCYRLVALLVVKNMFAIIYFSSLPKTREYFCRSW
jgi:hypothetical protein